MISGNSYAHDEQEIIPGRKKILAIKWPVCACLLLLCLI